MNKAKDIGIETYKAELNAKVQILEDLLKNYDAGRRKSFFCLAVNLIELSDLKSIWIPQMGSDDFQPSDRRIGGSLMTPTRAEGRLNSCWNF
jgi:hypothetical protein